MVRRNTMCLGPGNPLRDSVYEIHAHSTNHFHIGELVALFESTTGFMGTILMKSTTGGSTGLILPDGILKGSEAPPTAQPIIP